NFAHPQCIVAERSLRRIGERHPEGLHIVYHQVVRPLHDSETFAVLALEAWAQGRFADLLDAVAQQRTQTPERDALVLAARAHIHLPALRAAFADRRHAARLESDAALREQLGIPVIGAAWNGEASLDLGLDGMDRLYDRARERAARLIADGVPRERLYPAL